MTPEELDAIETVLDQKFYGGANWGVEPYLSPSEKQINKPILPTTNTSTNRMGHARNWPGPDTPLIEAWFFSQDDNQHTGVFTDMRLATDWLLRQEQGGMSVRY